MLYLYTHYSLYLASSVQLQDDVNSQSLDVLCSYVEKFLELVKGQKSKLKEDILILKQTDRAAVYKLII